jgi:iron complex transport system ATP-binding protein
VSLRVVQLTCRFGPLVALREVSAEAAAGRITAVLGPNAAGKSTLLNALIGFLRPAAGAVELDGRPVHRWRPRELAGRIAFVPQRSVVAASFLVQDVVRLGRYALRPDPGRVADALERLQLTEVATRPYPQLSVGQQQRVTLARALAQLEPDGHLVLDEPMSAMDLAHVRDAVGLLRELADGGATVIIAMHDLPLAAAIADDVWLLRSGELVAAGPAVRIMTEARLEAIFSVPFARIDADGRSLLAPEAWLARRD